MSIKNSSGNIGNRTRDLPTCSAVPQPDALLGPPIILNYVGMAPLTLKEKKILEPELCYQVSPSKSLIFSVVVRTESSSGGDSSFCRNVITIL